MPINYGKDVKGCFVRRGRQKKYYYECGNSSDKQKAEKKASAQRKAIYVRDAKNEPSSELGKVIKEQLKAQGITKPRKRQYRKKYPHQIERQYQTALVRYIAPLFQYTRKYLFPEITRIKDQFLREAGRKDTYSDEIDDSIVSLELRWSRNITDNDSRQLVLPFAQKTEAYHKKEFNRETRSLLGINPITSETWLPGLSDSWVANNVRLITSISSQYFTQIEGIVRRGVETGDSTKKIQDELIERFRVTRNRARLIARDQINKYYGKLDRARSQDIGITHFIWITAGDERVRTSHSILNNRRFSWRTGADGLFPGQDIQCRCIAENDFSVFFD